MAMIPSYYQGLLSEEELGNTKMNALAQGLLGAGQAFVRAGAPSLMPTSSGFVDAVSQGMAGYQGAVQGALNDRVKAAQVQDMLTKQKQAQELQSIFKTGDVKQIIPQLQQLGRFDLINDVAQSTIAMRKAGFNRPEGAAEAPSPFAPFLESASPAVRKLAGQLQQGFNSGVIDEETAYKRIEPLSRMEEQFANRQEAAANRAATAAEGKKPTEGEKKTATLAGRLEGALNDLSTISPEKLKPEIIPSLLQGKLVSYIPGAEMAAGKLSSSERLKAESAQLDALDAALTLGTGAAYTSEQLKGYAKSYFPQVGDTNDVIAAKNNRFARIVALAREQAGSAAKNIDIAKEKAKPFNLKAFTEEQGLEK